jgi:ADP-heptose:LPS heptosyltransferase
VGKRHHSYRYRPFHALLDKLMALQPSAKATKPTRPLLSTPRKILVLKFGGMGEAVLASSLLTSLKERNQFLQIDFLVEGRTSGVMNAAGAGKVYSYLPHKDDLWKAFNILRQVRHARYDAIVDFEQESLLTAAFVRLSGIPVRLGFSPSAPSPRSRLFTHLVQLREDKSMWQLFLQLVRILDPGIPESQQTVPLHYSDHAEAWVKQWRSANGISESGNPLIAMHLGVGPSAQYRRWPMERFLELANILAERLPDMSLILTGSSAEQSLTQSFRSRFRGRSVDASDLGELQHTLALLRHCDLMISGDTGMMHLSAAMGTPTVGLFGPNSSGCWGPVGPRATYVYNTQLACSPCINSYKRQIPEKCTHPQESACMSDISAEDVLQAAVRVMDPSHIGPLLPQFSILSNAS